MRTMLFSIVKVWRKTSEVIRGNPLILLPFAAIMLVDTVLLTVLYLAPRPPLLTLLGPIISAGWGPGFLHYPANLILLPKLYVYVRHIFGFFAGVYLSGIAVSMVQGVLKQKKTGIYYSIKKAASRYIRLVGVWIITAGILFSVSIVLETFISGRTPFALRLIVHMTAQAIFIFSIPAVIMENRKISSALRRSAALFTAKPLTALLIVMVPGILFLPLNYLHAQIPHLKEVFLPEAALYVLFTRVFVVSAVDFIVTITAAVFLFAYRMEEL